MSFWLRKTVLEPTRKYAPELWWILHKAPQFFLLFTDYFPYQHSCLLMNHTPHTNLVLEHFEMSLISYQTTSRPHEEMEVAATDTLKCHIGRVRLKVCALSTDRSLGPRRSLPPHCLSCLCPYHSLILLSCNNNKSEVYRLFRVEGKEGGSGRNVGVGPYFI